MTFREAEQYLNSFINYEIHPDQIRSSSFKMRRVRRLLSGLHDPHKNLKIIHVAGSKGKGSVCAMIASILKCAGFKTGLYTSPHIYHCRERIRLLTPGQTALKRAHEEALGLDQRKSEIYDDAISPEEFCAALGDVKPAAEAMRFDKEWGPLSFFELYTCLAVYFFYKQKTDYVVLETGMGGRLDATNAVDTMVAVLTPISLEHVHVLGSTVAEIAREKAGIIKDRKQKVVIAAQDDQAKDVFISRCGEFQIDPVLVQEDFKICNVNQCLSGQTFDMTSHRAQYSRLELPLLGRHQTENAAAAVGAVECLQGPGCSVTDSAIRAGLKNVFWPGRFEIVRHSPLTILDGAHNAASAKALSATMRALFPDKNIILVLGISKDKDADSICRELGAIARHVIFTKADHPRAGDLKGSVGVGQAMDLAYQKADRQDVILVTGSLYVISEVRGYLSMEGPECAN